MGCWLSQDRKRQAKTVSKNGHGDKGDRKVLASDPEPNRHNGGPRRAGRCHRAGPATLLGRRSGPGLSVSFEGRPMRQTLWLSVACVA